MIAITVEGTEVNFTKADCKGIRTQGSPVLLPETFLKIVLEE